MKEIPFPYSHAEWLGRTRMLSLRARGALKDLLCTMALHETLGTVSMSVTDYARFWSVKVDTAVTVLNELVSCNVLERLDDGERPCNATSNGHVIVRDICMFNYLNKLLKTRERVKIFRKTQNISFDEDALRFNGVTLEMIERWQGSYKAINIQEEIQKAERWLEVNHKNRKSNYGRFLINWFSKNQDRARIHGSGDFKAGRWK